MNLLYLIIALLVLVILWLLLLTLVLFKILTHYKRLTRGVENGSLIKLWEQYLAQAQNNELRIRNLEEAEHQLAEEGLRHLQKVGLVRFNPFTQVGGNQSFALALLDEGGDGVVISSLFGRENTRVYAKRVRNFVSLDFELSPEEKNAVHLAKNAES